MKCKTLGLVELNGDYQLVNTSLFPYSKGDPEEYRLLSKNVLRDIKGIDKAIELLNTLADDCEKNGNSEDAYYYRSAIPYLKSYKGD